MVDVTNGFQGPESLALRSTARGLITVAASFAYALVCLPYLVNATVTREALLLGVFGLGLLVLGLLRSRSMTGQWLLVGSMAVTMVWQMAYPNGTAEYSSIDPVIVFAGIGAVMLASRIAGLVIAICGALLVWLVWTFGPTDVVGMSEALGEGPEAVLQVFCALILAWWAWNSMRGEAELHDEQYERIVSATRAARDEHERAIARQEVSTVIHESLLNTIRYVLSAPKLQIGALAAEVERTEGLLPSQTEYPALSLESLGRVIESDAPSLTSVRIILHDVDVTLQRQVFVALRGAVSEAVRNAVQHGSADQVTVEFALARDDHMQITITDNGIGISADAVEGFGMRHAIIAAVEAVGGRVRTAQRSGSLEITLEVPVSTNDEPVLMRLDAFAKARFIVTSALAGFALGGLFFIWNLLTEFSPPAWLTSSVALVAYVTTAVIVIRRVSLSPVLGLGISLVVAAIPWTLVADSLTCSETSALIGLISASGASVITIALWTRKAAAVPGVLLWLIGVVVLLAQGPEGCRVVAAESSGYNVATAPILLFAGFFIMRMFERAQLANARAVEERRAQQARSETAQLIDAEYGALVREAQEILESVVRSESVSESQRSQLMQVEAKIRAVIQVNAETAGGFAVFALDVVNRFANRGLRVHTKSFVDSYDQRPVDDDVRRALRELVSSIRSGDLEVQLMTNGVRDLLTLKFSNLDVDIPDRDITVGDVTVHVSHLSLVDEAVQVSIVVVRPVLVNA